MSSKTVKTEDWKVKLKEERAELLKKTIEIKNFIDSPEAKLSWREWDMLNTQFHSMRGYLQALTDRCIYYKIIEGGDLNLLY